MSKKENIQTQNDIKPLDVKVKKAAANGQIYDMVTYDEYSAEPDQYLERTGVGILSEYKGEELLLPLRDKYNGQPISPGVYNAGPVDFIVYPDEISRPKYVPSKVAEFSNLMSIKDIINSAEIAKRLDEPFITTPDNITRISIEPEDQPEMRALKMALNEKNIDIDKYAGRFGDNFPNDKRQLKNNGATLNIIKRFCKNCDMEALITLRDKSPDVPNPMNTEITISLTEEFIDEDE